MSSAWGCNYCWTSQITCWIFLFWFSCILKEATEHPLAIDDRIDGSKVTLTVSIGSAAQVFLSAFCTLGERPCDGKGCCVRSCSAALPTAELSGGLSSSPGLPASSSAVLAVLPLRSRAFLTSTFRKPSLWPDQPFNFSSFYFCTFSTSF